MTSHNPRRALRPFWTYYGGKWRVAPRYPAPTYPRIVEPFAGAAGYSLRHAHLDVTLVDADETIAGIWTYLVSVSPAEIASLPDVPDGGTVDDVAWPCEEARWLAGFWLTRGGATPNKSASAWMRDPRYSAWSWGDKARERIASQVESIRHWTVIHGDYADAPDVPATWFVDPPYERAGTRYRMGSRSIDFAALAAWCRSRPGQVMVCEQAGADWLPFKPVFVAKANESVNGGKRSPEALWTGGVPDCFARDFPNAPGLSSEDFL